jgi:hypothetical protein
MKGKRDGEKLFEVKAGGGKDDSPAKNLRKRNVVQLVLGGSDDLFLVR